MKIFDWIVLIIFDQQLQLCENQFGYEAGSSKMLCSWTAIEVINNFKKDGAAVFGCLLDFRKAFDLVNHVKMFQVLLKRRISPIFIGLMIVVYLLQKCYIKWKETCSYSFSVTNGTHQGRVFSP